MNKLEKLRIMIKSDCAIDKYPNRNYSDYDKGREAGYRWVIKLIDNLKKE